MDKRFAFVALAIVLVIVASVALFYCWLQITAQQNSSPDYLNQSQKDVYLPFGGTLSSIYLVNSSATFGTFDYFVFYFYDFVLGSNGALLGDPYVNISGTIRNDDNKTLWVPLLARLYSTKGDQVGTIVHTNGRSEFLASYLGVPAHETGTFSITVKYDRAHERKDISGYNIYIAWEPSEFPPP